MSVQQSYVSCSPEWTSFYLRILQDQSRALFLPQPLRQSNTHMGSMTCWFAHFKGSTNVAVGCHTDHSPGPPQNHPVFHICNMGYTSQPRTLSRALLSQTTCWLPTSWDLTAIALRWASKAAALLPALEISADSLQVLQVYFSPSFVNDCATVLEHTAIPSTLTFL